MEEEEEEDVLVEVVAVVAMAEEDLPYSLTTAGHMDGVVTMVHSVNHLLLAINPMLPKPIAWVEATATWILRQHHQHDNLGAKTRYLMKRVN